MTDLQVTPTCYECGRLAHELSPRSRCVNCEHRRAVANEKENDQLRESLANAGHLAKTLDKFEQSIRVLQDAFKPPQSTLDALKAFAEDIERRSR